MVVRFGAFHAKDALNEVTGCNSVNKNGAVLFIEIPYGVRKLTHTVKLLRNFQQ